MRKCRNYQYIRRYDPARAAQSHWQGKHI